MLWALAIDRNHRDISRIVAGLFVMAEMAGDAVVATLPRWLHLVILEILRPAESAVRRLIVVAARGMIAGSVIVKTAPPEQISGGDEKRTPLFRLFDPRNNVDPKIKHVPGNGPGVRGFDGVECFPPKPHQPMPDDAICTKRLCRRLLALKNALDDLPKQARRLTRILAQGRSKWQRPMRPGRPPGHRAKGKREIDELLAECQKLALMALDTRPTPDTS